eukprot:2173457-Pyramimonas_sp.AAC.1
MEHPKSSYHHVRDRGARFVTDRLAPPPLPRPPGHALWTTEWLDCTMGPRGECLQAGLSGA